MLAEDSRFEAGHFRKPITMPATAKRSRGRTDTGTGVTKPPRELLDFLYRHDPAIQTLALGLRRVVVEEMGPCHEYIFTMRSKVVLLYGATEQVIKDNICAINVFGRHVNLGFSRGVDLKDDSGILQGNGKAWRHIRLKRLSELDRPEIRAHLRAARKGAGMKRTRRRTPDDVVTRVKKAQPAPSTWD